MRRQNIAWLIVLVLSIVSCSSPNKTPKQEFVDQLIAQMTLEEKFGQLNLLSNPIRSTGASADEVSVTNTHEMIRSGKVGNFLNVVGAKQTRELQQVAVEESRLGIPLLFGLDVIHGLKTIFPIPLADAASFDRKAMEHSAFYAALESSASGINWTYAPMIDVTRDPRWGRVMEGAGEDPYLVSQAGLARIKGFQGTNLSQSHTIAACAKHFVGYGASIAGRDYAPVDVSRRALYDIYFPPFKAAAEAGVASFMSAFNTVAGEPASASHWLLTEVLRDQWGYEGFVVSDWNSVLETLNHGISADTLDAAYQSITAGVDMDMCGRAYLKSHKDIMSKGGYTEADLDQMVARILGVKYDLGLFEDPYQYSDKEREKSKLYTTEALEAAHDVAKRSIVLLKNEENTLPIKEDVQSIAVIGPLGDDRDAPIGNWRAEGEANSAVSLLQGLRTAVGEDIKVSYAKGCDLVINANPQFHSQLEVNKTDRRGIAEAKTLARKSDVVILAVGETALMSGECRSYADLSLQGLQKELVSEIASCGKPVILALFTGRPLIITDEVAQVDAVLNCWLLGSKSGDAIADVILGKYNPSAKLPMTFPYHQGQVPICYSELKTGRPYTTDYENFGSRYRDVPNAPLYAFGYGLSYTTFEYSDIKLSSSVLNKQDSITITVTLRNTGSRAGEEVVQLYVRDLLAKGISRPMKELKGFEKVALEPGEETQVSFTLQADDLSYCQLDETFAPESGQFDVMVGGASDNLPLKESFELSL